MAAEVGVPAEEDNVREQLVHPLLGPGLGENEHDGLDVQEGSAHAPIEAVGERREQEKVSIGGGGHARGPEANEGCGERRRHHKQPSSIARNPGKKVK